MNRNDPQIPHREIDADEDELLDRLWEQTAGNESSHPAPSGYAELQERIHRRLRLRRIRRLACTGMAAAVVTAAVLLVGGPAPEAPDAFEQLAEMGVEIDRQEVVMTTDDGQRMNLDEAARLERHETGEMALNTAHESITIRPERRMKIEVPRGKEFHLTLAEGPKSGSMPARRSSIRPRSKGPPNGSSPSRAKPSSTYNATRAGRSA